MFSGPSEPIPHISQEQSAQDTPLQVGMKSFSLLFGTIGAVVVIAGLLLVFGVRWTSDQMSYDAAKEFTLQGTIVGFAEFACPASDGELERHLTLKTDKGEYEVHLAPSRIMRSVGWKFEQGDSIVVRGAPVQFRGKQGLLAKQITVGDNIYTIRDSSGRMLLTQ